MDCLPCPPSCRSLSQDADAAVSLCALGHQYPRDDECIIDAALVPPLARTKLEKSIVDHREVLMMSKRTNGTSEGAVRAWLQPMNSAPETAAPIYNHSGEDHGGSLSQIESIVESRSYLNTVAPSWEAIRNRPVAQPGSQLTPSSERIPRKYVKQVKDPKRDTSVPFEEMQRLMRVYGPLTCMRRRIPKDSGKVAKLDSIRRKFYRWFPDFDERFQKTSDGWYKPRFGHLVEMNYREEMRKKDQDILIKKRNSKRFESELIDATGKKLM